MKILLLGAQGQLGTRLRQALPGIAEVVALGRSGDSGLCGDLTQLAALRDTVRRLAPDVIVNAAAYTAVDLAESQAELAFAVNAAGPAALAEEAQACGAWLVHYSTDYVFDGSGSRPWQETDVPAPLNNYGRSKLAGEEAIRAACARHFILRTSWVFDALGANFLRTILQRAASQDTLSVVDDEIGAPTPAAWLADLTLQLIRQRSDSNAGTYHAAAAGETSWNGYARFALACAREQGHALRAGPENVAAIPAESLHRAAARPRNSRLSTGKLQRRFGIVPPPWQDGVRAAVQAWVAQAKTP